MTDGCDVGCFQCLVIEEGMLECCWVQMPCGVLIAPGVFSLSVGGYQNVGFTHQIAGYFSDPLKRKRRQIGCSGALPWFSHLYGALHPSLGVLP